MANAEQKVSREFATSHNNKLTSALYLHITVLGMEGMALKRGWAGTALRRLIETAGGRLYPFPA